MSFTGVLADGCGVGFPCLMGECMEALMGEIDKLVIEAGTDVGVEAG